MAPIARGHRGLTATHLSFRGTYIHVVVTIQAHAPTSAQYFGKSLDLPHTSARTGPRGPTVHISGHRPLIRVN